MVGPLRLDNNIIPECKTLKHVGIILENGFNSTERTITGCRLIRSRSMSIIKQGIHPSVMNPIVCSKIILQLCYTKALYGCELWNNLTNNEIVLLVMGFFSKKIFWFPMLLKKIFWFWWRKKKNSERNKRHNPPPPFQVKWSVPYVWIIILFPSVKL